MQSNPLMSVHIETLSLLACHQQHLKAPLYEAIEKELSERYANCLRIWKSTFLKQKPEPFVPFRYERIPLILATLVAQRSASPILLMDPVLIGRGSIGWYVDASRRPNTQGEVSLRMKYIDYEDRLVNKYATPYASVGLFTEADQRKLDAMSGQCSVEMILGDEVTLKLRLTQDVRSELFLKSCRSGSKVMGAIVELTESGERKEIQRFNLRRVSKSATEVVLRVSPEVVMYLMASDPSAFLELSAGKAKMVSPMCSVDSGALPAMLYQVDGEGDDLYIDISMELFKALQKTYPWLWCRNLAGLAALWQKGSCGSIA